MAKSKLILKCNGKNVWVNEQNICSIEPYTIYPYHVDEFGRCSEALVTFCGGNTMRVDMSSLPEDVRKAVTYQAIDSERCRIYY